MEGVRSDSAMFRGFRISVTVTCRVGWRVLGQKVLCLGSVLL